MVIIGTPRADLMDKYYMADGDMIWRLVQEGFHAAYMDDEVQYFKLNNKLKKWLDKNGIKW